MVYIHQAICISPQQTFAPVDLDMVSHPAGNRLAAKEPSYEGIPRNLLRRMGKAVRMGLGACLPLLKGSPSPVAAIIIGTANGGTEESFRFLQQMKEYGEDLLSPGGFVQSTANAIASQLSLTDGNKGYNLTHVHRGLAFEYALLDALLQSTENTGSFYLLAGVDETSDSNFALDSMEGWFSRGAFAGEGAAAFLIGGQPHNAIAALQAMDTLHETDAVAVQQRLDRFLRAHLPEGRGIDLFISGENGDPVLQDFYAAVDRLLPAGLPTARFKHFSGEYPTASAFALWLACRVFAGEKLPAHMLMPGLTGVPRTIFLYNTYKGRQHSFMLLGQGAENA